MRKLITSFISSSSAQPIKQGTLDHLQLAYQEALAGIANNLMGGIVDNVSVYILWGCVNSTTPSLFTISAGALYYAGEVYLVDAVTFTAAGGQTAVGTIVETFYNTNADPTTFTDGLSHNVHSIKKIVFASAVSGSGVTDFLNLKQTALVLKNDQEAALPSNYTITFDQDRAVFFASAPNSSTFTFDFTNAVPGAVVRLKWTFGSAKTLTVNTPSGSLITKDSGNLGAVASANNLFYCTYLGLNENGLNEVSYTLKQV